MMPPFKPEAIDEEKQGGLLIVKIDIEGAEVSAVKEVAK
jgi:hypothetical protein